MADTPAPMGRGAGYSDFARRNQEYQAKVDAHRSDIRTPQPPKKDKPKPEADDSYMKYVPDLAANLAQQAYQEARVQQQGNRLYESRSLSLPFKSEYHQSFGNRLGDVLTGTAQLASGEITGLDKYQEALGNNVGTDYGTQAKYLSEQFSKQNTEIAIARALGVDPSLIKKPNLLFAAATKDMKAHDIQRLATYSDFADAYNTMVLNRDGLVNASKTMTDRINELPSQVPSRVAGEAIDFTAGLIADAWHPVDNFMTKLLPEGSGNSENNAAMSSLGAISGGMVSWDQVKSGFGTAFNAVFDVQHTVRALHDVRATQGDAAYYSALSSVVGLTVALTFAGDGLGKLLLRGGGRALTEALVTRGISTEGLNLAGLTRLAERAGRSKADKKAWADASSEFISKIPAESQGGVVKALAELGYEGAVPGAAKTDTVGGITAYSREGGLGLTTAEREALSESGLPAKLGEEELPTDVSNRLGNLIGKGFNSIGRGLKYQPENKWGRLVYNATVGAPMLPFRHPEVPLNFNLAAQVLFNTNGLGMGDHWKDSWERTADGKTYVDPHTKRPVSLGREVADVLGGKPNDWWYNAVSGPLDLFTQFALDPTMAIFKALPAAFHAPALRSRTDVYNRLATDKGAQAMADAIVRINLKSETFRATKMAEVRKSLEASIAPRRKALKSIGASPEVIARATSSSKWRPTDAMIEAIVRAQNNEADSYADLLRLMPSISRPIEGADEATDFIAKLTTARSREDVADILGDMASANAMSDPYRLPSYSQFTRFKDYMYGKNRQAIADGDLSMLGKTQKTLARGATSLKPVYYQDARQFSNKLGRVGDPASLDLMRRVFLAAGRPPGEVDLLINKLARSTNTLEWQTIYKNFVTDQFAVESQSFLEDMVAKGKFSNYEAATLRNTLLNPFKSVIEQLSNTAGGGSSAGAYTGAKANFVVSQAAPFESDMLATAGLLGSHEHYFALPDYNAWDKFKSDIEKGLSSDAPDGLRSLIFQEGSRITAKPFDDRIAALASRSNELARQASPYKKQLREVLSEIKTKREMTTPVLKSAENVHNIAKTALKEKTQELKTLKAELEKAEKQFKKRLPKGDEDAVAGLLALREQANNKILVDDAKAAYDAKAAEVETFKGKVSEAKQNLDNTKISIEEGETPLTGKAEELKLTNDSFTSQTDALKRKIQTLNLERASAIQERMGGFKGFSLNGESRMDPKRAIYNMHDSVRHWFIDKYFRQAVLATGSFSMRVASAEAIASMFRLGAREYSKAWLANHVAEGIAKASGVGAKEITEAEHKVVMGMVHDVLTALHFPEGKQAVKGSVNSFLSGLSSGLGMDDFVQLLSRDIIERGGTLWGINASHGSMDSVSNAMHNLSSGYGTGNWESRNTLDNDSLSGLTKSLNDTAKFEPSRQTAEILDRNLDPAFKSENSLAKNNRFDMTPQEFEATGESLFHGTKREFEVFDLKNAINREGKTDRTINTGGFYFTDNSDVAKRFGPERDYHQLDQETFYPEGWDHYSSLSDAEKVQANKTFRKELKASLEKRNAEFYHYGDNGERKVLDPDTATLDDLFDSQYEAKYGKGRVVEPKVYGKTLDLRAPNVNIVRPTPSSRKEAETWYDSLPDFAKEYITNSITKSDDPFRIADAVNNWGRGFKHEYHGADLMRRAGEHGYGKVRVRDAYESNFESVIAHPDYIGYNRDIVGEYAKALPSAKTKTDDVYGRLETAREENRAALRRTVARDPKKYESILRSGAFINASTHDRLVKEVMQELGVDNMQSPMARNMLLIKQKKVNTVDEWADALFEHVLWLSHGRGKTTEMFESSNLNDKIFHRNVLKMLAEGKAPYTPDLTRDLYITPDLEQSRVMARQNMKRKPGTEKSSYHSHLYGKDGASFKDLKNLSDEEIAHFKLPPRRLASDEELTPTFEGMTSDAVYKSIIAANTPLKTGYMNKFAGKNKNSVSRMYEDINGESTSRFPANIPTQVPLPSSRASGLEALSAATIDRGASWVHDTISTPVINTLAREPLYAVEFAQQMNSLKPLVKDGTLSLEVAMNTARVRAIEHAIKFVHNPQDRFVFEQWARAFTPFWFAKNQALRRAGRLAIENPLGFERYLRAMMAMQNYGAASANNSDNNGALLMPGSMFGGRIMSDLLKTIGLAPAGGIPIGLRGSTSSLASVFPWTDPSGENPGNAISLAESLRPDFGPMISLPIRALSMAYPYSHGMQKLNDEALGPLGSRSSLFQQLVPNSLVRSVISMGLSAAHSRSSITASIDALQNGLMGQYYETKHHELSKSAREQAVFDWGLSHDENYTKQNSNEYKSYVDALTNAYVNEGIWYDGKEIQKPIGYYFTDPTERQYTIDRTHTAAIALYAGRTALSFFSPLALSVTEVNPEMRQLVRDAQATGGDFTKAEALYNNHPEAIYYVAHGTAAQTGIPLPATLDMSKFQNANADLFRKGGNASGLIAFVPYSDKGNEFDSNEYHTQLSAGLRRSLTPPEFLDKMAAAVGNNYVYNYLPKMNEKFENGNTESLRRAKSLYARANPLWTKTLGDSKASRVNALDQVRALLEIPGLDKREGFKVTAPKIRIILKNYDEFTQRYKNADSGWHNYLETQWEEWLKEYANKHKEITLGANSIFKGLKLSDNTGK